MIRTPRFLADAAVFTAPAVFVVLWASGFIGAKFGLPYAEPMTFLAVRMGGVVAVLALIIAATRPAWPSRTGMIHSAVTGFFVHGCYLGGVFVSIDHKLPAGFTALVVGLQPVLTSTLANRVLGEKVGSRQWLGLALGLAGVYLVVQGRTEGDAPLIAWAAATFALFGITIGTLYQKRFGGGIEWRTGLFVQYVTAALVFLVAAGATETMVIRWTGEFVFAVAWLVFGLSLGAIWLLYFMIRRQAATRVASLFYLTPTVTALMAWLLFEERLSVPSLAGMAICLVGVALVNWQAGADKPQ
ncbi:MAG: DMT family transporter [Rhizobiales bacterium]|jgi:drug/metabolite transporter (DMT)-like permease|nr:DMT family transporter [Hyphomicrobiales bacterium]